MDLPGLLRRAPELCLIDELAHTNAPGVEHAKRYEDIADVLDAGIDVFSTVNVQHLESLNDQVAELTGVRVRETFPDQRARPTPTRSCSIDLTPEALIERLREGKVYPQERVQTALDNFFRIENLAALREVALRQVAEEVEAKRLRRDPSAAPGARTAARSAAPQAFASACSRSSTPDPSSQRVVRRAWRSAQRLGAELDILVRAAARRRPRPRSASSSSALRRLAAVLGAHLLVEEGDDVADGGRARRARARHDLRADRRAAPRGAAARASREPLPMAARCAAARRRRPHRRRPQGRPPNLSDPPSVQTASLFGSARQTTEL